MADTVTVDLLNSWGLGALIETFRDAEIDQQVLESIDGDSSTIQALIPSIGKRLIFLASLKRYQSLVSLVDSKTPVIVIPSEESDLDLGILEMDDNNSSQALGFSESFNSTSSTIKLIEDEPSSSRPVPDFAMPTNKSFKTSGSEGKSKTKNKVPFPAPLPDLSKFVQKQISDGKLQSNPLAFIRECGNFLMKLTNGYPTALDYQRYSQTIVTAYPELADKSTSKSNASVAQQLSHYIRNTRYQTKKRNSPENTTKKRKRLYQNVSLGVGPVTVDVGTKQNSQSTDDMLKELNKNGKRGDSHVQLLLKLTTHERRIQVQKATCTTEVVEQFPHLQNMDMFMYDFNLVGTVKTENINDNFKTILGKISSIFNINNCENEVDIIRNFELLERRLQPKKIPKYRPAITVIQASKAIPDLTSSNIQAPCIVFIYTDEEGEAEPTDLFLLAEGKTVCHSTDNITAQAALTLLIGAYFVLDSHYPIVYTNLLTFLERELLQIVENPQFRGSITFNKFMKEYCQ